MTQLIKLILINIILFACSNSSEKKNKNFANLNEIAIDSGVKETKHTDTTAIPTKTNLNGNWICYKYIADTRYEQKYGDEYAQEISNFSNFKIKNDVIIMGNCKKNIYTYKYSTKLKKYEDESPFITFFKPKKDSVEFVGSINSGTNSDCLIADNFTLYKIDSDQLVQNDRGYFFYYKKSEKPKLGDDSEIIGIPGNNRNPWSVTINFNKKKSVSETYNYFKDSFPYGAKNLSKNIPTTKEFLDRDNGIFYTKKNGQLKIVKDDPMGKINIIFDESNEKNTITYKLEYPEYD